MHKINPTIDDIISALTSFINNRGFYNESVLYKPDIVKMFIDTMSSNGVYITEIENTNCEELSLSSLIYDIGMITLPDNILNRKGGLSTNELLEMQKHTSEGVRIFENIEQAIETKSSVSNTSLFKYAKILAFYHHERWSGCGYPQGLKMYEIPLLGRIIAIIDVYTALISERHYRKAFSREQAEKIIINGSGNLFDPSLVEIFISIRAIL